MLLTASEISSKRSLQWWFCLRAQAKREHLAAAYLRQYTEVEVFCLRVRFGESGKDAAFAVLSNSEIALVSWLTN